MLKKLRSKYWGWRINKIKDIAEQKYRLHSSEYHDLVRGYYEIVSFNSQKFNQFIIIILTLLLIYITWVGK